MQKRLSFLLLLFLAGNLLSQPVMRIKGSVVDSITNAAISFATVKLLSGSTKKIVKIAVANEDGSFEFELRAGRLPSLSLSVASLGYTTKIFALHDVDSLAQEIYRLAPLPAELKDVEVTAAKRLVKQEIDRVSYDVQADPESASLNTMEMLRKVPLISIDGNDDILLQGSGSYRIFINGRPSPLMAANMKEALRAMPANTIQKIEVITTPPAGYDAEGLAGIINIVLKKNTENGYRGTLTTRYSYPWGPHSNFTLTAKQGKLGFSGAAGGSLRAKNTTIATISRQTYAPASLFSQHGTVRAHGNSYYLTGELSYEPDSLDLFTASCYTTTARSYQAFRRKTEFTAASAGSRPQHYLLSNDNRSPFTMMDISANYQRGFTSNSKRFITFSYRYAGTARKRSTVITTTDRFNYDTPDNIQTGNSEAVENTLQVDYIHPMKNATLEAGVKAILRNNQSISGADNLVSTGGAEVYIPDPSRSNDFDYRQDVYSIYSSLLWKKGPCTFKAGIRMEQTRIAADFITDGTKLNTSYTNIGPVLSIMRTMSDKQSLVLGLSTRMERPGINLLNPFVDRSNPQLVNTGNPKLRPVQGYQAELGYTKTGKGTLNLRLSYLYSANTITNVVSVLSDTLSQATYDNIGRNASLRLNVNGNYPVGKLTAGISSGLSYVWISGPYLDRYYANDGLTGNSNISLSYRAGHEWVFGLTAGYTRPAFSLQGQSSDFYYSTLSIATSILQKKLSFFAALNNPFAKTLRYQQVLSTPDFYQSSTSDFYYRGFNISISYQIGSLEKEIRKNRRGIVNDDER